MGKLLVVMVVLDLIGNASTAGANNTGGGGGGGNSGGVGRAGGSGICIIRYPTNAL